MYLVKNLNFHSATSCMERHVDGNFDEGVHRFGPFYFFAIDCDDMGPKLHTTTISNVSVNFASMKAPDP